jgi:hypothetical protein
LLILSDYRAQVQTDQLPSSDNISQLIRQNVMAKQRITVSKLLLLLITCHQSDSFWRALSDRVPPHHPPVRNIKSVTNLALCPFCLFSGFLASCGSILQPGWSTRSKTPSQPSPARLTRPGRSVATPGAHSRLNLITEKIYRRMSIKDGGLQRMEMEMGEETFSLFFLK